MGLDCDVVPRVLPFHPLDVDRVIWTGTTRSRSTSGFVFSPLITPLYCSPKKANKWEREEIAADGGLTISRVVQNQGCSLVGSVLAGQIGAGRVKLDPTGPVRVGKKNC